MSEAKSMKYKAIAFKKSIIKAYGNKIISFDEFGKFLDIINEKIKLYKSEVLSNE